MRGFSGNGSPLLSAAGVCVMTVFALNVMLGVSASPFNVAVVDWQSIDGERPLDDDLSRSMTINFLLAAKHFNERRVDILPVLGEDWVRQCNMNVSIIHYCDTEAVLRKTVYNTGEILPDIHAIAGYATAAEGIHASVAADVLGNVPIVSHWCTTPQTEDRSIFPLFTRTVIADSNMAEKIALLISQMNYTRVVGLAMREDSSPELSNEIKKRLLDLGVTIEFFDFAIDDVDSMEMAAKNVAASGVNVIIVITYNFVIIDNLADVAKKYGLDAANKLIIFTNMDFELAYDDIITNPNVSDMVHGALRVSTLIDKTSPRIQSYLTKWQTEFDAKYFDYVNSILPPNGRGNDTFSCLNEAFNMTLPPNFFADHVDKYTEMWGIAYDSMLALALGACKSSGASRGPALIADIFALNFTGLSGQVLFDPETGNRQRNSFSFQVQNFQPKLDAFEAKRVALYDQYLDQFVFDNESDLYFRQGRGLESLAKEVDPPLTDKQYLPLYLRAIGIAGFLIIAIISFACSLWLVRNRKATIVVNSQGPLMHLINLGCFIASWAILLLTLDDNPAQLVLVNMDNVCMAIPVLFSLGFQIALLGLCGKTYRIYSIWNNKRIMTKRFSIKKVVTAVLGMVILELVVLICWVTIAPLKWKRLVIAMDRFDQPVMEIGMCDAESWTSGSFAVVVFILHGMLLLVIGGLAYQVSDMPGEFGEARWLGIACVLLSQIYLISLPAIAAVYSINVAGRFLLAMGLVLVSAFALLFVMFAPKMYFLATGRELFQKGSTNSRLQLAAVVEESSKEDPGGAAGSGGAVHKGASNNTSKNSANVTQVVDSFTAGVGGSNPSSIMRNIEAAKKHKSGTSLSKENVA